MRLIGFFTDFLLIMNLNFSGFAKLQMSDFSMTKNKSFINMLNNKGPSMEPCGIPCLISDHWLQDKPTFVRCLQELR